MNRRIVLLVLFITSVFIAHSQTVFNPVKAFDLDTDSIYNFYIDTIGTESGNAVFCFQTITGKLVKTDSDGSIISTTPNPYKYFAVYQGDTLILDDTIVINSKGDHIASILYEGEDRPELYESHFISVSPSGIYTYWGLNPHSTKSSYGDQIRNVIGSDRLTSSIFATHIIGLCVYQETIYALHYNFSDEYVSIGCKHEPISPSYDTFIDQVNLRNPAGIAGYKGSLYVYSNIDKALYRLEQTEPTNVNAFKNFSPDEQSISYGIDGKEIESNSSALQIRKNNDGVSKVIVK
ncbi:MAG: hypothetical protein IKO33_09225 [Bacteroidaceae bacterium]|nr:hypothetical protein [Bacteroidaceae bacterium]